MARIIGTIDEIPDQYESSRTFLRESVDETVAELEERYSYYISDYTELTARRQNMLILNQAEASPAQVLQRIGRRRSRRGRC